MGQKSLSWIRLIMICYIVPWWPSWLSDQIAQSDLPFGSRCDFKIFKLAAMVGILDIRKESFL